MRSVVLQLPPDVSEDDARLLLAVRLFEEGRVSLGKAAEIAGYGRPAFMEILVHKGVASVSYPAEELADDLRNA
jgi:predicted HTH domain antitoxin